MDRHAELKRKLRKLKRLESLIRFGTENIESSRVKTDWVWDVFFAAGEKRSPKYSLDMLTDMDRHRYRQMVDEFIYHVYYRLNKDNPVFTDNIQYDPAILSQMGLPPDADAQAVRKKFRALAKEYHPDAGGDEVLFITLKKQYNALMNKE